MHNANAFMQRLHLNHRFWLA